MSSGSHCSESTVKYQSTIRASNRLQMPGSSALGQKSSGKIKRPTTIIINNSININDTISTNNINDTIIINDRLHQTDLFPHKSRAPWPVHK
eukprot:m.603712 g.603712  ORF g.603712 m.603712 type:complete len:92 (+) comp58103_c1_seq12:360-635(+)